MRCRSRVDCERTGVADICNVVEELQRIDEVPSGIASAVELEPYEASKSAVQVRPRPLPGHTSVTGYTTRDTAG